MDGKIEQLRSWNEQLKQYEIIETEHMPDIDLYMDQVITFVTKQLSVFSNESDKIITPSMINNYTKDGIIPRPVNKKYDKMHLTSILMMCVFKQIIPINDITIFIDKEQEENIFKQYQTFSEMQNALVRQAAKRMAEVLDDIDETQSAEVLTNLAMQMIIEANVLSSYAKKILNTINEAPIKEKTKNEKQKSEKSKNNPDPKAKHS